MTAEPPPAEEHDPWADCFPLPEGYSAEPEPFTDEQIATLAMLFMAAKRRTVKDPQ